MGGLIMAYPMTGKINPAAFCQSKPLLGEAVRQAHQNYQAPYRLCLMGGLAALSSAAQSLADVVMPYGAKVPTSLSLVGIALSGERKSTVERRFMKEIKALDDNIEEEHGSNLADYRLKMLEWKSRKKQLEKQLVKSGGDDHELTSIREELRELLATEPTKPQRAKLVYEDISPMAMLNALNETGVGTLVSSEGGIIVDGKSFDAVPHLNSLWSGDKVSVARVGKPSLNISDARLTVSIMLQPEIFKPHTDKKGEKVRGSGHWARYLVFNPVSTQGDRLSMYQANSWEHLEAFDRRIREILSKARMARVVGDVEREEIRFAEEAAAEWYKLADRIEIAIRSGGEFEKASDHASKLGENIARVAALLHYFEGDGDVISVETLNVAADICAECSHDFLQLFVPPPEEVRDAVELDKLINRMRDDGLRFIRRTYLHKRCPNAQRTGGRFFRALDVLLREGVIRSYVDMSNAQCLDLCPLLPLPWGVQNGHH
ncbi:MAG: hypothetical protein CL539_05225 [Alcanivorax sp.]|nr:hypothetical protein [Alcanivorax sp.]|tara:strand:+ start:11293 stop:12756 length:1464 start_codon:yes stop_codon:yes gene_type:complete